MPTTDTLLELLRKILVLDQMSPTQQSEVLGKIRDGCLTSTVQRDLLRQFLRYTSTGSLQLMKWRVERSRRALLREMVEITHRRLPLIQARRPMRMENLKGVNESQLRGYIMYFAAKLPLITNIKRYLDDAKDADDITKHDMETIEPLYHSWFSLVDAIDDNLKGLERAIEQARQDRLLREEERIRSEEEDIAEAQRINERSLAQEGGKSEGAVGVASNFLESVAFVSGTLLAFRAFSIRPPNLSWPPDQETATSLTYIGVVILVAGIFFISVHVLFGIITAYTSRRRLEKRRRESERYYYEMDVSLNVLIDADKARELLEEDDRTSKAKRHHPGKSELYATHTHRTSYRSERASRDETIHKVYLATTVHWPKTSKRRLRVFRRKAVNDLSPMRIYLIYEMLFHRPSEIHSFILTSIRVISPYGHVLSADQLKDLKVLVAEEFINRWITDKQDRLQLPRDLSELSKQLPDFKVDAFFTLNISEEKPYTKMPETASDIA